MLLAAVDQPAVELAACLADRLSRDPQVVDVVERVVQPEDVDAARSGGEHEAPDELVGDGSRADEEAAAHREREGGLHPRLDAADPLPRAFDAAAHAGVEDAAARDLERGKSSAVEDLREPQELRGRDRARQRLLRQHTDRRVDEPWHSWEPSSEVQARLM